MRRWGDPQPAEAQRAAHFLDQPELVELTSALHGRHYADYGRNTYRIRRPSPTNSSPPDQREASSSLTLLDREDGRASLSSNSWRNCRFSGSARAVAPAIATLLSAQRTYRCKGGQRNSSRAPVPDAALRRGQAPGR